MPDRNQKREAKGQDVPPPWEREVEILPIRSQLIDYAHPIWGTYLTTGARAQRGYRLAKFCMSFMKPANRDAFKSHAERYMSEFGLNPYERELVRRQDWNGMLRYGVSTFMVLKLSNVLGVGQNRTGAKMRGQSYEEFMATRNVKDAS